MKELDSTQALLDSTIELVDSVIQDDSEEEVFFGKRSDKEALGGLKKCRYYNFILTASIVCLVLRRDTMESQAQLPTGGLNRRQLKDSCPSLTEMGVEVNIKHGGRKTPS